jgi:LDH2 family malate/lactate/ureidoglycolate dehydrogenase
MHPDEILIQPDPFRSFISQLFQRTGVPGPDADAVADVLVRTDLRGIFSHGTRLAPNYLNHILDGHMNPQPQTRVERQTPAMALIDADRGIGHLAALDGMKRAIEKARHVGLGMVNVRRSHHLGAASIYAMMALEHGMIGFVTTNTGGPSVAPFGGRGGALANHPLAWAFPTRGQFPIVVDMAVGVAAWQRVETMRIYGQKLPPGWCLDKDGNETDDPAKAWTMFPAGGTRGYGLALVAGLLTGALSGGQFASRRKRYDASEDSEHTFLAISIDHFVGREQYLSEVDEAIAACQRTPPLEGFDRVRVPGEMEWEKEQKWRVEGIPLHREHLNKLATIAEKLNVPIVW